jgi:hypothetical protein
MCATTVRGGALEEKLAVTTFVRLLQQEPSLSDAIIVFAAENAPGIEASHLYSYLRDDKRVCTMHEMPGGRAGVPKTNLITRELQYQMESLLTMGGLRYAEKLVVFKSKPDELKQKLEAQLENFRWDEIPTGNDLAAKRFKLHGKGGGQNDDLLISCMMATYWGMRWTSSHTSEYAPYQFFARNGYFEKTMPVRMRIAGAYARV